MDTSKIGNYPSEQNNGISKMINDFSYDTNNVISAARNGSAGSSFLQCGKFGITTDVLVLELINLTIDTNKLHIWCVMLNYYLKNKYNYSNKIIIDKLMNEEIYIPEFKN